MINFKPDLAAMVMRGEKTQTRRVPNDKPGSPWYRERCTFAAGQDHAVCCGRGSGPAIGRVVIDGVEIVRLGDITHADALAEGCAGGVPAFRELWTRVNHRWDPDLLVWRLVFHPRT